MTPSEHVVPFTRELVHALEDDSLVGDYRLSPQAEWFQPYEPDDIDWNELKSAFDGVSTTSQGLLTGTIRICNTGCEGYHLYVFSGKEEGSIWSDQRIPFGRLTKICESLALYLSNLELFGNAHATHYEKFS